MADPDAIRAILVSGLDQIAKQDGVGVRGQRAETDQDKGKGDQPSWQRDLNLLAGHYMALEGRRAFARCGAYETLLKASGDPRQLLQ